MKFEYPEKLYPVLTSTKRNICLYGGRGGSKSWIVAAMLVAKALDVKNKDKIILCAREIQVSIKDSVFSLIVQTIERFNVQSRFRILNNEIVSDQNVRFIFKGLYRNLQNIKSTEGIYWAWIEEAQTISQESIDLLWPTVRTEGSQFIITFNPGLEDDPIYQRFVANPRDDTLLIKINYDENPFFPDVLKSEMLYDKEYDYDKYRHVWLGECKNITDACVFKNKFTIMDFETPKDAYFFYGADFGFSKDPSTLIRSFELHDCLYIDYEAGGVGVEFEEMAGLWDTVPGSRKNKIVADSSRPDTISYMSRQGFYVRGSRKGKNSIEDGIEHLRSYKMIYIHTRCKNTAYEFRSYSYKQDKLTNEILPVILDANNHYIDALRYSHEDNRRNRQYAKTLKW